MRNKRRPHVDLHFCAAAEKCLVSIHSSKMRKKFYFKPFLQLLIFINFLLRAKMGQCFAGQNQHDGQTAKIVYWHRTIGNCKQLPIKFTLHKLDFELFMQQIRLREPDFNGQLYYKDNNGPVQLRDQSDLFDLYKHSKPGPLNIYSNEEGSILPIANSMELQPFGSGNKAERNDLIKQLFLNGFEILGKEYKFQKDNDFFTNSKKNFVENEFVEKFGKRGIALDLDDILIHMADKYNLGNPLIWSVNCWHFHEDRGQLLAYVHRVQPWRKNKNVDDVEFITKDAIHGFGTTFLDFWKNRESLGYDPSFSGSMHFSGISGNMLVQLTQLHYEHCSGEPIGNGLIKLVKKFYSSIEGHVLKLERIVADDLEFRDFLNMFRPTLIEMCSLEGIKSNFHWASTSMAFLFAKVCIIRRSAQFNDQEIAKFGGNAVLELLHTPWAMPWNFQRHFTDKISARFDLNHLLVDYLPSYHTTCRVAAAGYSREIVFEMMCLPGRVFYIDLELISDPNGKTYVGRPLEFVLLFYEEFIRSRKRISYLLFINCSLGPDILPNYSLKCINSLGEEFSMKRFVEDKDTVESRILCIERCYIDSSKCLKANISQQNHIVLNFQNGQDNVIVLNELCVVAQHSQE